MKSKSPRIKRRQLFLLAMIGILMVGCGTQIPSGHRGVFYSKFGDGTEFGNIYPEGFAWHLPWNSMFVYQTQIQEKKELLQVLSSDGATMRLEVSMLYRPVEDKLDSLQVTIGPNYYNVSISDGIIGLRQNMEAIQNQHRRCPYLNTEFDTRHGNRFVEQLLLSSWKRCS